ncbi:MAG: hypothetical protein MH204_11610, partial [Fimbriimonadaceae bacterium]|nr:hypothetical protein [Fimbriimonadaceae bacterium]
MPILSRIGRRSLRARLGMAFLYGLLILGALTTLGPFVVMVSTAFKGPTDQNDHALIPRFFSDPAELAVKYRSAKSSADENRIAVLAEGPASISAEEARDFGRFLENLPTDEWTAGFRNGPGQVTGRLNVRYQAWLRTRYATIGDVNAAYAEISQAFAQVSPPPELFDRIGWNPKPGRKWDDWSEFKQTLPAEFRIPLTRRALWIAWLKARTSGRIGELPPAIRGDASAFEQAAMPEDHPWYAEFRAEGVPERFRGRLLPDEQWVQLTGRPWPWTAWENAFLAENRSGLTREFAGQNFAYILDFIALNGRALWNTLIFCLLAVAVQLIVNPLCAYAISRHPGPWMSRLLLILLATMAFPAEVAMIPAFLLLKDFGLLNTFAALVLPGAAAGFSIFLLKGF